MLDILENPDMGERGQEEVLRRIKHAMKEKGVKQTHVARALGLTFGGFSKIMKGNSRLTVTTLLQIAEVLGVEPASLLPEHPDSKHGPAPTFEDYVRRIVRNEISGKDTQ